MKKLSKFLYWYVFLGAFFHNLVSCSLKRCNCEKATINFSETVIFRHAPKVDYNYRATYFFGQSLALKSNKELTLKSLEAVVGKYDLKSSINKKEYLLYYKIPSSNAGVNAAIILVNINENETIRNIGFGLMPNAM